MRLTKIQIKYIIAIAMPNLISHRGYIYIVYCLQSTVTAFTSNFFFALYSKLAFFFVISKNTERKDETR